MTPEIRNLLKEARTIIRTHARWTAKDWDERATKALANPPAARAQPPQPPQRTWKGLTDKATTKVVDSMPRGINGWMSDWDLYEYARAIEAKLKEKNT